MSTFEEPNTSVRHLLLASRLPTTNHIMPANSTNHRDPLSQAERNNLLKERIVVLDQTLVDDFAKEAITRILFLQHEHSREPIRLFIDSRGGEAVSGFAILDTIDLVSPPVHTHCYGCAEAMAAIILAHGARAHRSAVRDSKLSLSVPWADNYSTQSTDELSEQLDRVRSHISQLLASDTGRPIDEIQAAMSRFTQYNASEAMKYGLFDFISDESPWDLLG